MPWTVSSPFRMHPGVCLSATPEALVGGMQEDFVTLHDEAAGMRTRFLAVCSSST